MLRQFTDGFLRDWTGTDKSGDEFGQEVKYWRRENPSGIHRPSLVSHLTY